MEHRSAARIRAVLKAEIRYNDGLMSVPCVVRDISETGARIELSGEVALPDRFDLYIEKRHRTYKAVVKRRQGTEIGVAFETTPEPSAAAEAGLVERVAKLEAEIAEVHRVLTQLATALNRKD